MATLGPSLNARRLFTLATGSTATTGDAYVINSITGNADQAYWDGLLDEPAGVFPAMRPAPYFAAARPLYPPQRERARRGGVAVVARARVRRCSARPWCGR